MEKRFNFLKRTEDLLGMVSKASTEKTVFTDEAIAAINEFAAETL
nr:MAG TPA: hypothetical protein [Caudoviricetes sp.]